MTDRLFADCCYGTESQHMAGEPCPQETPAERIRHLLGRGYGEFVEVADLEALLAERDALAAAAQTYIDHPMRETRVALEAALTKDRGAAA